MKIKYFPNTDTLYIEFRAAEILETRDLDENTQLDIDKDGNVCAMTIEHARTDSGLKGDGSSRFPSNPIKR
jgi:uncharacterized protein YuzE